MSHARMLLTPGSRLGPYEIMAALGAGGMGEVYRARDTRLGRDVAIKVLPQHLSENPELRARFEREAKTVSSLNHPHICTLHDIGRQTETDYLVMELVEGETLEQRLTKGALPPAEVMRLGAQIADALGRAHRAGIVHRDLKPGNVMLTKGAGGSVIVKLMDFGLASAGVAGPGSGSGLTQAAMTQSPTVAAALTREGTIVGTFQYMAPEQLEGRDADSRADLWALGCVLYEMASGKRTFDGTSQASLIASIMKDEPRPLSEQSSLTPPGLERVVRQCLAKDPDERWQTASDLRRELLWVAIGSGSNMASAPVAAAAPARPVRLVFAAVLGAVILAAAATSLLLARRSDPLSNISFEQRTWDDFCVTNARFGPEGGTIFFSAAATGNIPGLYVIRPGTFTAQPLGDPATHLLSVSSKGELVVLTGARYQHHRIYSGTLARMTVDGAPRPWLENVSEADWSPDGTTLAIIRNENGTDLLEYPIGRVLHRGPGYLSDPRISPDGSRVAFFEHPLKGDDRGWVKVVGADGKATTLAGEYWGEEGIAWSRDGRDVLFSASAEGADLQVLTVNASGRPVVRQPLPSPTILIIHDRSPDGRLLVARESNRQSIRALVPGESTEREFPWLDLAWAGSLSRDGRSLLFSDGSQSAGANYAVSLRDVGSARVVRLGEGTAFPLSPDGRWAGSEMPATGEIVLYPTGTGQAVHVKRDPIEHTTAATRWFPDSARLLVCGSEKGKLPRAYEIGITGDAVPKAVTPEDVAEALLTDDGRTLLTRSTGGEFRVLPIGGDEAVPARGLNANDQCMAWSADGRAVFAWVRGTLPARVDRVDVTTGLRTTVRELRTPETAGLASVDMYQWINDGQGYVYGYRRNIDALYVVSGLR